jgi:hypothetical protein
MDGYRYQDALHSKWGTQEYFGDVCQSALLDVGGVFDGWCRVGLSSGASVSALPARRSPGAIFLLVAGVNVAIYV